MATNVTVEWGSRSKALQRQLQQKISGDSFLLVSPGAGPINLGWVGPLDIGSWDTAATIAVPLTRQGNQLAVTAALNPPSVPDLENPALALNYLHLRLDFALVVTAGGKTATVLAFRQLFLAGTTGTLQPVQCAFDDVALKATPTGPVPLPAAASQPRRRFGGLHPLLTVSPGNVSVNAEFVDLTALWWSLRNDKLGWYCHPSLGGRQTNLRVLGWTGGGSPMIWFAVIPDAAVSSLKPTAPTAGAKSPAEPAASERADTPTPTPAGDVVFFRPPPEVNSFFYSADERGLVDPTHDGKTQYILSRYLLSPIPASDFAALQSGGTVKKIELLADQLQPTGGTPSASPQPADPMDIAPSYPTAFRPVGLENALNNAGASRVLLLPLAAGDTATPYEGAVLPAFRTTVASALMVLWNAAAVSRLDTTIPDFSSRELWLAGHSAGNLSMWNCAGKNAADIGRMITFDASTWEKNLAGGINTIRAVAAARKQAKRSLDVFAIVTPHLSQNKANPPAGHPFQGLDDDTDLALRRTGAVITVLPEFAQRETFWKPAPVSTPKTYIQYFLANWSDALLTASAKQPSRWRFLFFHEMAVFGGDLIPPASGAPPNSSPTLKTFFEQALGPPNPRPPP